MKLFVNEDNDHYFKLGEAYLNEDAMRKYIDQYAEMGVDTMSFCIMGQRTNFESAHANPNFFPEDK